MKECASKCYIHHIPCAQSECRLHLDYEEDLNCTEIAVYEALLKLKKTLSEENTI